MFDKVVAFIVGLGIPGIVLLIAIATTGLTGGAAIVAALATLGGPFGMLGGMALLGVMVLISKGIATYGFEEILVVCLKGLREKGISKAEIIRKVMRYPISRAMKLKVKEALESLPDNPDDALFENIVAECAKRFREEGISKAEIIRSVDDYPISQEMKRWIKEALESMLDDGDDGLGSPVPAKK